MSHNIWRRWVSRLFKQNFRARTRTRKQRRLEIESLEDRVVPAIDTWTGLGTGTTSADWSNVGNWSLNRAPITGDTVIFNSTGLASNRSVIDNLTTNPVLSSVNISGTGYTLGNAGASTLIVSGGITVASSENTINITQPVEFLPPPSTPQETITVNNGSILNMADPNASGQITAGSGVTVSMTGTGTLILAGSSPNWLGAFALASTNGGGIVQVENAKALGSTTVTVNTNTQLQLVGGSAPFSIANSLLLNGSGIVGDGGLLNASGNNTWSGSIQMDSDSTIGTSSGTNLTITGTISDNGAGHNLTKQGAGTILLPNPNTYRGTTTVNNGILEIENPLSLGAGANALDSQSGSPQSETIVNQNSIAHQFGTLELNFNAADVATTDPNALFLQNPTVAYNAKTNPLEGFQVFNDILVLNGGGFNGMGALYNASGNNEWDGSIILGGAPPQVANPVIDIAAKTQLIASGIVSDPNQTSSLTKIGTGELVFSDANTYRGGTLISAGTLDIADSQALGTNSVTVSSGAALQMDVDSGFDGTPLRTHQRNLGFDSVNGSGVGQELYVGGTLGTFTLSLGGQNSTSLNVTSLTLASQIQAALNGPTGLLAEAGFTESVATVTQDGDLYRIIYSSSGTSSEIPLLTANSTGGASVSVNPIYGLTASNSLFIAGPGIATGPDTGALNSDSGINVWAGTIDLEGTAAIGVAADNQTNAEAYNQVVTTRLGHPLPDDNYLQWDYSLTVSGLISGGDLIKTGLGDLILPRANTYGDTTGVGSPTTDIQLGWITMKNDNSLGQNSQPALTDIPQTLEPYVEVDSGGALHLDPLPGTSLTFYDNFLLSGTGLTSPTYGLINEAGAIENINGDNTLPGIIQLNGTVGIGVEQIPPTSPNPPNTGFPALISTTPPLAASQLTLTGYLWNYINPNTGTVALGGIDKLGSRRLIIQGSGTYTGNVDVQQGVLLVQNDTALGAGNSTSANPPTVTVETGAALEFGNTASGENVGNGFVSENGGVQNGIEVWGERLVLNGSGDPTFVDSALSVLASNAPTTGPTVQTVTVTGSTTGSYALSFDGVTTAALAATANAAQVQTAIDAALNALTGNLSGGSVEVIQDGNTFTVTFGGSLINTAIQLLPVATTPYSGTFAIVNSTQIGSTSIVVAPVNDPLVASDAAWRGPVTLNDDTTITVDTNSTLPTSESASRLILSGTVGDLYNSSNSASPPPSDLTILGGGEVDLNGANTYSGTTYAQQGVVSIDNPLALGTSGIPEIQAVTLAAATPNSTKFFLTFGGYAALNSTPTSTSVITFTGNVATDEANITAALDALPGIGGGTDTGGSVSVVESIATGTGAVTITITFGGTLSGFPLKLLGASIMVGTGTPVVSRVQAGAGGTIVENGASMEVAGSFTVAGEPLILEGNGTTQDIQTVTVSGGSTGQFTLQFTGPGPTGNVVTNTATLAIPSNLDLLTSEIQSALNAMSNIGGVGGSVTVTETASGSGIFDIAFGGALSGEDVVSSPQSTAPPLSLTVNATLDVGGTVTTQTLQAGSKTIAGVPTQWFQVGPEETTNGSTDGNQAVSGQVTSIAVDPNDPTVMYIGTAGGGVWKSIDDGNSWHQIFDAIPEIQTLTVSKNATGLFTLTYTGDDSTGTTVSDTTTDLNAASSTLAGDIQAALDALSNIGGVGGQVTVSQDGSIYMVAFNGSLAGSKLALLTASSVSLLGSVTPQEFEAGLDPNFAMYVGAVAIAPSNSNIIYVGTGVTENSTGSGTNQVVVDSGYGTGVYKSMDGGLTWSLLVDNTSGINANGQAVDNPVTGTELVNPFFGMAVSGIAVDPFNSSTIYVSDGTVGGNNPNTDPPTTAIGGTTGIDSHVSSGEGVINGNNGLADMQTVSPPAGIPGVPIGDGFINPGGTGQLAGVWRFTTTTQTVSGVTSTANTWFDLTNVVSVTRDTLDGQSGLGPPQLPGPDDDFRVSFPEATANDAFADVRWTDVQIVYTSVASDGTDPTGAQVPVLYAALGTPDDVGVANALEGTTTTPLALQGANGVYRALNPESTTPTWYLGDPGTPKDQVDELTINYNLDSDALFTLNFEGENTTLGGAGFFPGIGPMTFDPTQAGKVAQEIQANLDNLSDIGGLPNPGNVTVTVANNVAGSVTFDITFGGGLAFTPLPPVTSNFWIAPITTITWGIVTPGGGSDEESPQEFPTEIVFGATQNNGNIKLSLAPGQGGIGTDLNGIVAYASVANSSTGNLLGIYSTAGVGQGWQEIADLDTFNDMNGQGNYANAIVATDVGTLYIGGAASNIDNPTDMLYVSYDGGVSWTSITEDSNGNSPHNAVHALAQSGNNVVAGTDGGIWQLNGTTNDWTDLNTNLATALVNGVDAAQSNPNDLVVGTEGNGLAYTGLSGGSNTSPAWTESDRNGNAADGPNGGTVYIDPNNPNIIYAVISNTYSGAGSTPESATGSSLIVSTNGGQTWSPVPVSPNLANTQDYPYFPFVLDPLNTSRLLVGGPNGLQQSLNGASSWLTLLGGDVTAIAVAAYQGVYVSDAKFPDVTDIGANVDDPSTIYAAMNNQLMVTKDLGLRWVDRTPSGMTGTIQSITVNQANRDNVFVVTQGPSGQGDNQLWETTDAGNSWTLIGGAGSAIAGLADIPLWQVVVDPRNGNLYIGTDNGVYELANAAPLTPQGPAFIPVAGSVSWERFGIGMPNVSVRDLKLNLSTNTLLAGTYGRGVYQLYLDAPETATDATFAADGSEVISAPASGAAIGLSGSSFWAGPVVVVGDAATGDATIGADGTQGIPDGITTASIDFVGAISDATAGSNPTLNKDGLGDVIFSGANVYGGQTVVEQGNLIAENLQALGGNANGTTVITGASLGLLANLNAEPVTLNGNGISFDNHYLGALRNIAGTNTFQGSVTLNEPDAFAPNTETIGADSGSTLVMVGSISDAASGVGAGFSLVKEGTGTVVFDNTSSTSPNSYTGNTSVYQGALRAETSNAFGASTVIVLDGAQVQLLTPTGSSPIAVSNALLVSGSGINGTGALLDVGGNNSWSGPITFEILPGFYPFTLSTGTVALGANAGDVLTVSGSIDEEKGSTVGSPNGVSPLPNGVIPLGLLKVGAGTVALANSNTFSGTTEVGNGILDVQNPTALGNRTTAGGLETIEQIVTYSNSNEGVGTGDFTLSFDGKTASATKLHFGTGSSAVMKVLEGSGGGGGLFASAGFVGATVEVFRTAIQTTTQANEPSIPIDPTDVTGWLYTLVFGGSLAEPTVLQAPIQVEANGTNGTTATTSIVAAGGVDAVVDSTANGTGELELDNSALGSPSTGLTVSKYTLTLNGAGPGGNGALYNLVGNNAWTGPVILASNPAVASPGITLDAVGVAPATSTEPSSLSLTNVQSISAQVGSLVPQQPELEKVGAGTLIFPTGSTYYSAETAFSSDTQVNPLNGTTLVTAGSVQVDASFASESTGVGPILLDGGTVSGNGSVPSITYGASGESGTIDPGDNYPSEISGLLTSTGNVTLNAEDTLYVNLGIPTNTNLPPTTTNNNDVLDVGGTIYLNGASLSGLVSQQVAIGDSYTVLNAASIVGEFANQGPNNIVPAESGAVYATVSYIDGVKFEVDYISTANNGVVNRVDVIRKLAAVSLTLTPSVASPVYGQDEQFQAKLTAEPGAPEPTGTVVFTVTDPTGLVTTYSIVMPTNPATGIATLDIAAVLDEPLIEGPNGYRVTASYNGIDANGNFTFTPQTNVAMSPPTVTVGSASTTSSLSLFYPQPEVYGQTFTLTDTVSTTVANTVANTLAPAGTVSFYDGSTLLQTVALSTPPAGTTTATAVLSSLSLSTLLAFGNHTIYAVYNPVANPANYTTSTGVVGLSVHQDATTVSVSTPTLNPAPVYGQAGVVFTATVTPVSPGSGDPTGNVTFRDGALILGMGTLSTTNGVTTATYTTTSGQLLEGSTQITATYYGDTNFTGNTGSFTEVTNKANSTVTISSSAPAGVPYGQSVTFTATVAAAYPGGGSPSGIVAFMDGATILGTGALNTVNGVSTATYTTTPFQLPVGSPIVLPTIQTITAQYFGDGNFNGSTTSAGVQQLITLAASTTSVVTTGASVYGQPVTITATVHPTAIGGLTPSGTVSFYLSGSTKPLGTGIVGTTGGVSTASYTTTLGQLPVGVNQTIVAVYSGDSHYATSTGTTSQTVTQDSTTTALTASGAALPGGSVTFTAQIAANSPGGGFPTGSVSFTDGSISLGSATIVDNNGVTTAQITVPSSELPVGINQITASYSGDVDFLASQGSLSEESEDETTTTVTSSLNPSVYGQQIYLTATITPSETANINPTGTVTFTLGTTTLGTTTVGTVGGVSSAVLIISSLPAGTNEAIQASYSGDSTFIGSAGTLLQTVAKTATTTTLSSTATSIEKGEAIILSAQVFPTAPGGGTPTGKVTFKDGATVLGTGTLSAGFASLQTTLSIVGMNKITAVYGGDTDDLASTSPPLAIAVGAVGARASKVTLTSSLDPSYFGQSVTFTATVKDAGGGVAQTPTGTVEFFDGKVLLGYGGLVASGGAIKATYTTATLPLGASSITAVYNGNTLFARASSAALTQTVNADPVRTSTITLSESSTTTSYGIPVVFTAVVTDTGGGVAQTPTGTVTFVATDGSTVITMGSATLSGASGTATAALSYANLPAISTGKYTITASYSGDASFLPESNLTSPPVYHVVTEATGANVALSSSLPAGSVYGQAVTFTATVTIAGTTTPAQGSVDFTNSTTGVDYGSFALNSAGQTFLKVSTLLTGTDEIVATYSGFSPNVGSGGTSSLLQTVNQASTKTSLVTTATSATPVIMTATVAAVTPGAGSPTGTVSFYIDGTLVGTSSLNAMEQATYTYQPGVTAGKHTLEVVYNGDTNFAESTFSEVVNFTEGRKS